MFEVVWIFLLFFLVAGSLPPDVGESHYLPKARHYWQPGWCAGDLFLESHDAHWTFYWAYGWITTLVSLPAAAWIGRVVTWVLLAWSWRRLSWAIVPRPLFSLLSAAWFLLLTRNFHLAGEWVVGGVEAKGFAYVLVFLALEAVARSRWQAALLFSGAAGAFHVLVGGWTAVALGFAWLLAGKERPGLRSNCARRVRRTSACAAGPRSGNRAEPRRAAGCCPRGGAHLRLRAAVAPSGLSRLRGVERGPLSVSGGGLAGGVLAVAKTARAGPCRMGRGRGRDHCRYWHRDRSVAGAAGQSAA